MVSRINTHKHILVKHAIETPNIYKPIALEQPNQLSEKASKCKRLSLVLPRVWMPPATPLMRDEHGLSQALIENHQFIVCKQLFMCSNRLHLPRILGLRCGNAAEGTPLVSKPNQEMHKRTGMENNWLLHDFACLLPIPSCKRLSIGRVYIGYSALKVERSVSLSLEEPRPARSILNGSCIRLTNFCCY